MKQALFIGAIASVLTLNNAMATGENTVTSKSYVDAQDALKQDMLLANDSETYPGGSVVTYGAVDGEPGAMQVYGLGTFLDVEFPEEKTVILSELGYTQEDLEVEDSILPTLAQFEYLNLLIQKKETKMTCAGWPDGVHHIDENCWLWYKN